MFGGGTVRFQKVYKLRLYLFSPESEMYFVSPCPDVVSAQSPGG